MTVQHQRPYTIKLFVPNDNPQDLKVISKMNWTGKGFEVSRDAWEQFNDREAVIVEWSVSDVL